MCDEPWRKGAQETQVTRRIALDRAFTAEFQGVYVRCAESGTVLLRWRPHEGLTGFPAQEAIGLWRLVELEQIGQQCAVLWVANGKGLA